MLAVIRAFLATAAILNQEFAAESKIVAKYAKSYVDASTWTGSHMKFYGGSV